MIRLSRAPVPSYLSDEKKKELTDRFKVDGTAVWRHKEITSPLLQSSHEKCCYCECSLGAESKYMEVEHFAHKDKYPDLVVEWTNLLPACKRCNIAKGVHDVIVEPILNPYEHVPSEHLKFKLFRLAGKTDLGESTISALDLNNSKRLVVKRFEIADAVITSIEVSVERLNFYQSNRQVRYRNRVLAMVEVILLECQSRAIYSSITATVVFDSEEFLNVVKRLREMSEWPSHLEVLYSSAQGSILSS